MVEQSKSAWLLIFKRETDIHPKFQDVDRASINTHYSLDMSLTRRQFLRSMVGAAALVELGGCASAWPDVRGPTPLNKMSLRDAGAKSGILAGCAVQVQHLRDAPAYADLVRSQAAIVVEENIFKFGPLRPTSDSFFFDDADYLAAFAEKNGIKLRGHNFVWHKQLPRWFSNYVTEENAQAVLVQHIETIGNRYAGKIHSWDVVNEAIEVGDGLPNGLRNSVWQKLLPRYIDIAFRTARQADPKALLVYNDYGIEREDESSAKKRTAVLNLISGMKMRGVPIDAIGIQSHLTAGTNHYYGAGLTNFMQQVSDLGLKILLTEMDVNDRNLPADISQRDEIIGDAYSSYLNLTLSNPDVIALLTWGITDKYTWLNGEYGRSDKLTERCLPFDDTFQAKPAFHAEIEALSKAVPRRI